MISRTCKKVWQWFDDRAGVTETVMPIMTHLAPRDARWWYVFGSAAACALVVQVITGVFLALIYVPGGEEAYQSLKFITEQAPFGSLLRGMHYYGATAMVVMVLLHMSQVFLHGTYKFPRELNWISGVVLLFCMLGMAFTGQMLRWDSNGVWSIVVAAEMMGNVPLIGHELVRLVLAGDTVNGATLSRFFVLHVMVLPGVMAASLGLHMWLVLRHGISAMPKAGDPVDPATYREKYETELKATGEPFWPNAMWRDLVVSALMVIVIFLLAWLVGPPAMGQPPDPSDLHANPAPDWYFLFYFAILSLMPPSWEVFVIVGGPLVVGLGLFLLPFLSTRGERAPSKRPWAVGALICVWLGFIVLTIYGAKAPWSPDFAARPLTAEVVDSEDPAVQRGATLFFKKGCIYCHEISGQGGHRGPNLSDVGLRLTKADLIIRINTGGHNMPSFAGNMEREQLDDLVVFLQSRNPDRDR